VYDSINNSKKYFDLAIVEFIIMLSKIGTFDIPAVSGVL